MKPCFGVLPGLYRVVEPGVDAQVVPFPFEADGGAPPLLPGVPLHAGHAAGIVFADRLGAEHLHAGPVDISKAGPADGGRGLSEKVLVAPAGGAVPVPQALGGDDRVISAVAAA